MKQLKWVVVTLCCALLSACAPAEQSNQTGEGNMSNDHEIRELAQGGQSRESAERMMIVRDPEAFERIWALTRQQGEVPAVDFDQEMVIAAFMGERRTGGYSIHVEELRQEGDVLRVHVRMESPGENCMTTQAITRPFQLVRVPRLEGEVQFATRQQTVDC